MAVAAAPGDVGACPFVGRRAELELLRGALERARAGRGGLWLLKGPGGIGKTWLMRQLEGVAVGEFGFEARWAYAMQGLPTPFFLLDQLFRLPVRTPAERPEDPARCGEGTLPTLLFLEDNLPDRLLATAEGVADARTLLLTRENPKVYRERFPELLQRARALWLTRSEGEGHLAPTKLDEVGELVGHHLQTYGPKGLVVLTGLEYLLTQNGFVPTLRLVQHVHDQAEESGGHVLVALRPGTFEPRERALLTSEGEVRSPRAPGEERDGDPDAPLSLRVLRYLDRMERSARARPQLLLLDDLQWSDPLSAQALGLLLRHAPRWPMLVVASLREEGAAETGEVPAVGPGAGLPAIQKVLETLMREGTSRTLDLRGLAREDAEHLCRTLAPAGLPDNPTLFDELLRRTGGNPFYLREVVLENVRTGGTVLAGWLKEAGADEGRASRPVAGPVELPLSIRRLVGQRMSTLTSDERRLLRSAALLGSTFDEDPLAATSGAPSSSTVPELLDGLHRKHRLLEPGRERPRTWTFAQPFVWEVVTRETPSMEMREQARAFAEWFAQHRSDDVETVARFYHRAQVKEPGLLWTRRARDRARRQQAAQAMTVYVQWTLDLLGTGSEDRTERAREELLLAEALAMGGKVEASLQVSRGVAGEFPRGELHWRAWLTEADALSEVRPKESGERLRTLLQETAPLEGTLPAELRVDILSLASDHEMMRGDPEKGASLARAGLDLLPPSEASRRRVLLLDHLAWSRLKQGRYDEAVEAFREGARDADRAGELALKAYHLNGEGAVLYSRGELLPARRLLEDAATLSRAVGDELNAAIHLITVAGVLGDLGESARSRERLREALHLSERFEHYRPMYDAHEGLALLDGREQRWEEARTHLQTALEVAQRAEMEPRTARAQALLAWLKGEEGDPVAGLSALPREGGLPEARLERIRSRLLWLAGRREQAVEALRRSLGSSATLTVPGLARAEVQVLLGRALSDTGQAEEGTRLLEEGISALRSMGLRHPGSVPWV